MSYCKLVPSLLVAAFAVGITTSHTEAKAKAQAQVNVGTGIVIEDIDLDGVEVVNGVLTATGGTVSGTIAGLPFTTDVENFELQLLPLPGGGTGGGGGNCAVLDLELGPIDVDLLGLHVDTSAICLNISAMEGEGLLGDLLCNLAGGNLGRLLRGLPDVLNPVLNRSMAQAETPAADADDICDGECEILDLAVGPVDLTLLGLNVMLDDCEDGPVLVCVSASEDEGLLGDLLCGLADGGILPDLGNLENLLGTLLDALDADLTPRQVNKLVNKLTRQAGDLLEDGNLSPADIAKLTKTITKAIGNA